MDTKKKRQPEKDDLDSEAICADGNWTQGKKKARFKRTVGGT
jgi:hypothetical protein